MLSTLQNNELIMLEQLTYLSEDVIQAAVQYKTP